MNDQTVTFEEISKDQSWEFFDRAAERLLGLSGEEFAKRWADGEYDDCADVDVMQVAMLQPGGRQDSR